MDDVSKSKVVLSRADQGQLARADDRDPEKVGYPLPLFSLYHLRALGRKVFESVPSPFLPPFLPPSLPRVALRFAGADGG